MHLLLTCHSPLGLWRTRDGSPLRRGSSCAGSPLRQNTTRGSVRRCSRTSRNRIRSHRSSDTGRSCRCGTCRRSRLPPSHPRKRRNCECRIRSSSGGEYKQQQNLNCCCCCCFYSCCCYQEVRIDVVKQTQNLGDGKRRYSGMDGVGS